MLPKFNLFYRLWDNETKKGLTVYIQMLAKFFYLVKKGIKKYKSFIIEHVTTCCAAPMIQFSNKIKKGNWSDAIFIYGACFISIRGNLISSVSYLIR
jgi:hypothetical protein